MMREDIKGLPTHPSYCVCSYPSWHSQIGYWHPLASVSQLTICVFGGGRYNGHGGVVGNSVK